MFNLCGMSYSDLDKVANKIYPGQVLTAIHEKENQYDSNAIALFVDDYKIGYVPRGTINPSSMGMLMVNKLHLCGDQVIGMSIVIM